MLPRTIPHALLAPSSILTLLLAACGDEPYGTTVKAEARLQARDGAAVSGRFMVVHGQGFPEDMSVPADGFRLGDPSPRRLVVYDAATCDVDPRSARPFDPPPVAATPAQADGQLGLLRRVGDEVVFWRPELAIPGQDGANLINAGIEGLSVVPGGPSSMIGKLAVVQAADGADGTPGAWQACGVIVATDREE